MTNQTLENFNHNKSKIKWLLIFLNFIMIVSFFFLNNISDRFASHNRHLTYSVSNIKFLVAKSQILYSEGKNLKAENYFQKVLSDLDILKNGGSAKGINYEPSSNVKIDHSLEKIMGDTNTLLSKLKQKSVIKNDFDKLIGEINTLDQFINKRYKRMFQSYREFKVTLVSLIIIVGLLTIYFVAKINTRTGKELEKIDEKIDTADQINKDLEKKLEDESVKSINQEKELFNTKKELYNIDILKEIIDLTKDMEISDIHNKVIQEHFNNVLAKGVSKKSFSVDDTIQRAKSIIDEILKNSSVSLVLENRSQDLELKSYETKLINVILSLMLNMKERFDETDMDNKQIKISVLKENEELNIEISDNAGGMDEKMISRIFKPQLALFNLSLSKRSNLYMDYDTVKHNLKGDIKVENIDKGSSFKISIPII